MMMRGARAGDHFFFGMDCVQRRMIWLSSAVVALVLTAPLLAEANLADATRTFYRGDYAVAAMRAREYLQAHPTAVAARILLARTQIAEGDYQRAYQELVKAVRCNPKNIDALYFLGWVCIALSQAEYRELFQMAPGYFRAHQVLAESYLAEGDNAKSEEEYQAALKANPQALDVLDALGDLKRANLHCDEAVVYYARATELSPHDYDSSYGLGACALSQSRPQLAIAHFRKAVKIDPTSQAARYRLGDALLRVGKPAAAVTELKAAVALEPGMRQAYALLARAYGRLGQSQAAEEALKKELALEQTETL